MNRLNKNRVCCFQTLDAVFPKDPFERLFRDHNSCRCAVWRPQKVSPYNYFFTLSGPLGLKGSTLLFGSRVALNPGLGGVSDVASAVISHE